MQSKETSVANIVYFSRLNQTEEFIKSTQTPIPSQTKRQEIYFLTFFYINCDICSISVSCEL